MYQRTWLKVDVLAAQLAAKAGIRPLSKDGCARVIMGCSELLVEQHIPRSVSYTNAPMGYRWAEDGEKMEYGDRVVVTADFLTYYVMTIDFGVADGRPPRNLVGGGG